MAFIFSTDLLNQCEFKPTSFYFHNFASVAIASATWLGKNLGQSLFGVVPSSTSSLTLHGKSMR